MLDWKAEKEDQGQRFTGLKEVAEMCAEDWKDLPEWNQAKYKKMEKEAKQKDKADLSNKYNSLGVTFEEINKQQNAEMEADSKMKSEILNTMHRLSHDVESLASHYFYLVHANIYCYHTAGKVFIPCELAISKFSVKDGVVDTYHVFPSPFTPNGALPMGYRSDALSMKENVHGIPEPMEFEEKMSDWESIRRGICQFLGTTDRNEFPPLYTMLGDDPNTNCYMTAVKNFFDNVANGTDWEFRVHSLPELFFKLYETCQQVASKLYGDTQQAFPVQGIAQTELMKDVYNFSPGLACKYHETTDFYHNCSLSFVRRWVFLISEFCCQPLKIDLIPGYHCLSTARISTNSRSTAPPRQPALQQSQAQVVQKPLPAPTAPNHSVASAWGPSRGPSIAPSRAPLHGDQFSNASDDDGDDGEWSKVGKLQRGMRNLQVNDEKVKLSSSYSNSKDDGGWNTVSMGQRRPKTDTVTASGSGAEIAFIDRSKVPDPSKTRIFMTGQGANIVSELMPENGVPTGLRRPYGKGRGELLAEAAAAQKLKAAGASPPGFSPNDFPAIGASRTATDRQPKPTTGWGRGFMKS